MDQLRLLFGVLWGQWGLKKVRMQSPFGIRFSAFPVQLFKFKILQTHSHVLCTIGSSSGGMGFRLSCFVESQTPSTQQSLYQHWDGWRQLGSGSVISTEPLPRGQDLENSGSAFFHLSQPGSWGIWLHLEQKDISIPIPWSRCPASSNGLLHLFPLGHGLNLSILPGMSKFLA